jgi:hypothetical protein
MSKQTFDDWFVDKIGYFTFKFIFVCAIIGFWVGLFYFIWSML